MGNEVMQIVEGVMYLGVRVVGKRGDGGMGGKR